jgi:hypothetical protein
MLRIASRVQDNDNSAPIGWLIFACCFIVTGADLAINSATHGWNLRGR